MEKWYEIEMKYSSGQVSCVVEGIMGIWKELYFDGKVLPDSVLISDASEGREHEPQRLFEGSLAGALVWTLGLKDDPPSEMILALEANLTEAFLFRHKKVKDGQED